MSRIYNSTMVRQCDRDLSEGIFGRITFLEHDVLDARLLGERRFRSTTFSEKLLKSKNLFWRHNKSEAGRKVSTTGSNHNRETRNLTRTLISVLWNFSIKLKGRKIFTVKVRIQSGVY